MMDQGEQWNEQWILLAMNSEASDGWGSNRWIRKQVSYEAFEVPMDQKAIKVVMDWKQAMDQKAKDGSGSKDDQEVREY